jgi:hypothetical protein
MTWSFLRKPTFWGVLYLLGIPGFAGIYWRMPSGFYQSTSRHESDIAALTAAVTKDVELGLEWQLLPTKVYGGTDVVPAAARQVVIVASQVTDEGVSFSAEVLVQDVLAKGIDPNTRFISYAGHLKFPTWRDDVPVECAAQDADGSRMWTLPIELRNIHPIGGKGTGSSPPLENLFGSQDILDQSIDVPLLNCAEEHLWDLAKVAQGNPLTAPGSYWRMFYFSATTMTTLGPGDIVPVRDLSRFVVGAEAIYGVVMVGLFLWSLTNRLAENIDGDAPPRGEILDDDPCGLTRSGDPVDQGPESAVSRSALRLEEVAVKEKEVIPAPSRADEFESRSLEDTT